jgi:hypothetical protein
MLGHYPSLSRRVEPERRAGNQLDHAEEVNRCPRVAVERPLGCPNSETSFMRISAQQTLKWAEHLGGNRYVL